jgi:protease-4
MRSRSPLPLVLVLALSLALGGCAAPRLTLFPDATDPYRESTLEGSGPNKVLLLQIEGQISEESSSGMLRNRPGVVQEMVAQLRRAEKDDRIRALVLKVNSPGGSVTASDLLYHELSSYKQRTGVPVVAVLMGLAASGGYYVSLPADRIVAHPTTVTGSVGVIFLQPKVDGLMAKIGVGVDVAKSGERKDMGSPFRPSTPEEQRLIQELTAGLGQRFTDLVARHRKIEGAALAEVASARVFLAPEALKLGLVDEIGYLPDGFAAARRLAGLPADARVVTYRRSEYPDDTAYNTLEAALPGTAPALVNLDLPVDLGPYRTGFYYLWPLAGP